MDNRPIGVFDSSVGGISVLRELVHLMPNERYVYLGDTLNAPYGVRDEDDIRALTRAAAGRLMELGVKALVVACNTATSAAAEVLRQSLPIPVIGMEPALKPAALARKSGRVAVLATPATLRQMKFQRLFQKYGEHAVALPCPGLMEYVERFELDSDGLKDYLRARLDPAGGEPFTAIVLGCTHYVFLRPTIRALFPEMKLYDGNRGTALQLQAVLRARDALCGEGEAGSVHLLTTGREAEILPVMDRLLHITADE